MAMGVFAFRPDLRAGCCIALLIALSATSRIGSATDLLYLDRCSGGCLVTPGVDDAINHVSSVVSSTRVLSAFPYGDAAFVATAGCLTRAFSHYDVKVTVVDPGPLPRREIMLAGFSQNLGLPGGIQAIAPLYAQPRDNAIAFVFAEQLAGNVDKMCWLAAQHVGLLYALDFELHCPDLMSQASSCGLKSFANIDAQCGEVSPRACMNGASTQNSAVLLMANPGLGDRLFLSDFEPPAPVP
jgi:hypothetical protein